MATSNHSIRNAQKKAVTWLNVAYATFRLQSFLSVTYNVIGLSNVFTHQKKLVVSHKKVAETELRYT